MVPLRACAFIVTFDCLTLFGTRASTLTAGVTWSLWLVGFRVTAEVAQCVVVIATSAIKNALINTNDAVACARISWRTSAQPAINVEISLQLRASIIVVDTSIGPWTRALCAGILVWIGFVSVDCTVPAFWIVLPSCATTARGCSIPLALTIASLTTSKLGWVLDVASPTTFTPTATTPTCSFNIQEQHANAEGCDQQRDGELHVESCIAKGYRA